MTPGFQGVITHRYKYVEFDDGSRQLIDLKKDPHELHDLSRNPRDAGLRRQMVSKLHALMRPQLQTTIATGPDGAVSSRVAEFSFFSPSRFATYRCRLIRRGKTAPWRSCPGGFAAFSDLADGSYRFEVAGISESGRIDPTPASGSSRCRSSGPERLARLASRSVHRPPTSAAFTYASTSSGVGFQCRLVPLNMTAPLGPPATVRRVVHRPRSTAATDSTSVPATRADEVSAPGRRMVLPRGHHRPHRGVLQRAGGQHPQ